ncbi:jmjC domain-containing protein 4-like isoform X2 [Orbicella faveolata]|uniref:jmjC domain-containing protein 4-like isoform X2 n=1 Tax=Orbicella faveolata TaxID=48498 RepID=UPI0009E32A7F|nr:jmjC domain-containing protein 4-like isoform X2 [Orbicella faveolata]
MDDLKRIGAIKCREFFEFFLETNQLCIFSSELTQHWRSRKEWVKDGKPDLDYLSKEFGHAIAPVANCCQTKYGSQVKEDMSVKQFCDYWRNRSQGINDTQTLYLKDWHFCKAFPAYNAYETPVYFKSDFLNEFWDQRSDVADDYRFVYMGPKGSWTPFHADVFRSYSWSANICGCKKWLIYPPGQEKYLTDRLGNLVYDITSDDMNDRHQFPDFEKASKPITVIQREGEVIFVPSGWHHQVINLEDTISINHNWTNACGIYKMWEHLQSELSKVHRSIEDCRDMENWHEHCQVVLRASCGLNYEEFVEFLDVIASPRIRTITGKVVDEGNQDKHLDSKKSHSKTESKSSVFQDWSASMKTLEEQEQQLLIDYCRYDLVKVKECLMSLKDETSFIKLQNKHLQIVVDELLREIHAALDRKP